MKKIQLCIILILLNVGLYAQSTLRGTITDQNKMSLPGANVWIQQLNKGTTSDHNGNYSFKNIPEGTWKIQVSMVGYQIAERKVDFTKNVKMKLDIALNNSNELLDEVVISSSRYPERLSEIPTSISVVNKQQLEHFSQSSTNLNEILEFTIPGLAPSTGTYSNWGQTLRGRKLLVMVDGIAQSTPLRNGQVSLKSISPNDIERVEVIKGATSIYGNGGDGGFINYITKKSLSDKAIEGNTKVWGISGLAKTKDAQGFGLYQMLKGNHNKISYYASGSYEKTGNKYDADGTAILPTYGMDNTKIISVLGKLAYHITNNQTLSFSANHYRSRQNSPFLPVNAEFNVSNKEGDYILKHGYGEKNGQANPGKPGGATNSNFRLSYELDNIFSGSTNFNTDVYYQKGKNIFFYSESFEGGGQSVINSKKYGFRPNFNTGLQITDAIEASITYGVDILKDKTNQGLLDGRLWVPNLNLLGIAPYMQASIKVNQSWNFKAGFRYDKMKLKVKDYTTLPYSARRDGNFTKPIDVKGADLKFDNSSFNFGIRYIKNNQFIPYLSYSQGFSLSDLGRTLRGALTTDVNDIELKAVVTNNYEFGFLSKFDHVRFEAVGYYSTSNFGTGLNFNDETNRFENSSSPQKIYGAEVIIDFNFLNNTLFFGASYSYVEGLKHPKENKNDLSYIGGDVISPPKLTAYVTINPTKKLSTSVRMIHVGDRNRFKPLSDGTGGWKYNYREAPVRGYTVFNFTSSYNIKENLTLSLAVNNLLNKKYLPARAQWAAPLRSQSPAGEGANAKVSLSYKF